LHDNLLFLGKPSKLPHKKQVRRSIRGLTVEPVSIFHHFGPDQKIDLLHHHIPRQKTEAVESMSAAM